MVRIVCLEGNIGCGKSTILWELQRRGYTVFFEPIKNWKYVFGAFASSPTSHCFPFQVQIAASFAEQGTAIASLDPDKIKGGVIFVERSFASHATFVATAVANGWLDDIEQRCLANLVSAVRWDPDDHIYIDVDAATCLERIRLRNRGEESGVTLERLHQIRAAHVSAGLLRQTVKNDDGVPAAVDMILQIVASASN